MKSTSERDSLGDLAAASIQVSRYHCCSGGSRPDKQSGQAMVLGLMFLATALMFMLFMYNQGQLTRHRVQLENAADATVYSQAKLAARNQNFVAYTNRAMVANEVSIGQVNALMSWSARYRDMNRFITGYAPYNSTIGPIPVTFSMILSGITAPYVAMGTGINAATKPVSIHWPTIVSYFNSGVGVFQGLFTLSTLVAQFEVNQDVLKGNQLESDNADIYAPFISYYFLLQNTLMTYSGDHFDAAPFVNALEQGLGVANTGDTSAGDQVRAYFPGESMISLNSPAVTGGPAAADSLKAYQYYSAIVNKNKDPFTNDRHWGFELTVPDMIPPFRMQYGIMSVTIDLALQIGFVLASDGGSTYGANGGLESARDIKKLGWSAIDVTSFGLDLLAGLYIEARIDFGFFSETFVLLNESSLFDARIGFPLGGGASQTVSKVQFAKKIMTDWSRLNEPNGQYGGNPRDAENNGAFEQIHFQTLMVGQTAGGNIFGPPTSVNTNYGGPPAFISLGESFRESRRSFEYTVALAIDLNDIETSDNADTFDIGNSSETPADSWLEGNEMSIGYTRFDLDTCARAEEASGVGSYQQSVWGSERPMTTISSAEVYFSNPMKPYAKGSEEPASLFSPFWDARLIEPSLIPTLVASGQIPYQELFGPGIPNEAIGATRWLLRKMGEQLVDRAIDTAVAEVKSPFQSMVRRQLDAAGNVALRNNDRVVGALANGLTQFVGSAGGANCAG